MPVRTCAKSFLGAKHMKKSAQHVSSSTQAFTEILDIRDNVVLMRGGNACLLVELQSTNFSLLSSEEQDAKVFGYAGLLNSLSFPVQIVIRSKKVDIMPYIASLGEAATNTTNEKLTKDILAYKAFVEKLVTSTSVLDKQFFFVISYSLLEEGIGGVTKMSSSSLEDFFVKAHAGLKTKAESLLSQIDRMNLRAKIVEQNQLISLFHDLFNEK